MIDLETTTPCFICGHRKSGTTLLVALLDAHPQLLVYPDDSKFFQLFYPFIALSDADKETKLSVIIEKIFAYTQDVLKKNKIFGMGGFDAPVLEKSLKKYFVNNQHPSWCEYLRGMMAAFSRTTSQKLNSVKHWVEKTTSSEIYALEIDKSFPKSFFIHVIRDPRDNYASLKAGWHSKYRFLNDTATLEALRQSCIERGRLGMELGRFNQSLIGKDRYLIVRYEDLVVMPNDTLSKITKFLNIGMHDSLLKPTILGIPWEGNNMEGKQFIGINSGQVGKWKDRIDEHEAALMEFHFYDLMKYYEYEFSFSDSERARAASEHYKWSNFHGDRKGDFKFSLMDNKNWL